jgi:hypothetical protein
MIKKVVSILIICSFLCQLGTSCKKETVVEKIIYKDTPTNGLYLLEFITLPQSSTTSRVIFNLKDFKASTNTSYENTLFNVNTATIHDQNTLTVSKAVYDSVNYTDYYRSTTISRPSNDTIKIIFRIGTQGDVDIKTE